MKNIGIREPRFRKIVESAKNQLLSSFSYNLRTIRSPAKPNIDNIEITNFCNLRCIMCPITKMKREKQFMDFSLLSKIIDENPHLGTVWLHNFGEPLLHPELTNMIRYCKRKHVHTGISTNATLLTPDIGRNLIEAGLDYIVFSFDGATKETYEKIRIGANFYNVKENIVSFIKLKQEKGAKNPFITVQIIRMKETDGDIKLFYDFWKTAGVDSIRIKGFDTFAGSVGTSGTKDEYLYNCNQRFRYPCKWLWKDVVVLVDGTVVMCCRDFNGEIALGNLKEKKLEDIWNSKQFLDLRKKHKKMDLKEISVCSKCREWYGMPINPTWPLSARTLIALHDVMSRKINPKTDFVSNKSPQENFQGEIPVNAMHSEKLVENKRGSQNQR